ncbi:hypothetical protein HPB50_008928 [Hyalomma asiaticum]|uniref:Uncharacterized protein n=1 Tax=Hyalomma asiaticum TaxID=266040 RepID=A0ACB7TGW0_HYAAI|nr:hypothetical protein HPB50_008928 [Hyalomma asiaticum]
MSVVYRYDVCPNPKSGLCSRCGDKHDRQDLPSCIPSCILCGGQHLTGTGSCKARNTTAPRRSPPPQKTKFPTKEYFPPLLSTNPCSSTWSSKVAKMNSTTSQDSEMKVLREEGITDPLTVPFSDHKAIIVKAKKQTRRSAAAQ